ncbi:hypothetical protein 101114BS4_008 [Escherichia phage vB_EcoS-101114BS4]|uniref:Uncharacterized protein n=1 Tax=Escherichia phage vB_EcoS-101114BS4 TaxID=2865793 RepID=A0AAE8C323_9CAUD|nr:hypothetical protein P9606_gp08 [Escherichia phage vB_EcoS-101114BS4]QZI79068.1 hypothetical protein 101114BS4_008 [Escherichia phage vB_EcoS-101114BS4]
MGTGYLVHRSIHRYGYLRIVIARRHRDRGILSSVP